MSSGGYECPILLLEKNKDLINAADDNGWTVFHYVAHNDISRLIEFLLNIDDESVAYLPDKKYKRTALHVAAYKGRVTVMKKLLKKLPDAWESVDGNGQNILHIAVKQDQKSVIKFILSAQFDMKNNLFVQRDKEGNTPLHLIAKLGCYFPELLDVPRWGADWDVLDNTNFTPMDVLHEEQTGSLVDEALVGVPLNRSYVRDHWNRWIAKKVLEVEKVDEESIKWHRQMVNTHMIVAALITTVALTAGFAMPGGFDGNQGPTQGSALLLRKTAFKTFMVADTIALLFSISSLFLYFLTAMYNKSRVLGPLISIAVVLNIISITAMMLAFIAGTYAVLAHSSVLPITVCMISSLFFLLVFYICIDYCREFITASKKVYKTMY